MSDDATPRLGFPFLAMGQAQKELTHNQALVMADFLIQPVVQSANLLAPPPALTAGQCWIVGASATGDWAGKEAMLACWTAGGWQFLSPFEGMRVWSLADITYLQWTASSWLIGVINARSVSVDGIQVIGSRSGNIAAPSAGAVVDAEARIAIDQILSALRGHGLIAT